MIMEFYNVNYFSGFTVKTCFTLQSPHQNIDSYLNAEVMLQIDSR